MRTIHILWLDVSREFLFHFSCNRPANLSRNALTDKWEGLLPVLLLRWIYLADTLLFCYVDKEPQYYMHDKLYFIHCLDFTLMQAADEEKFILHCHQRHGFYMISE